MEPEQKFKNGWDRFWNEMDPEGLTRKEAFGVFFLGVGMTWGLINLAMWLSQPHIAEPITKILFPFK